MLKKSPVDFFSVGWLGAALRHPCKSFAIFRLGFGRRFRGALAGRFYGVFQQPASRAAVYGVLFLLLAATWSCSIRLTDLASYPAAAVRLDVAPYTQEPEKCGPYALAAVLGYLGKEVPAAELSERLYSAGAHGSLTMDLYLEAVRRGVPARQFWGSFEIAVRDLDAGLPAIILIRYGTMGAGRGHFVVATGYSRRPDGFFLLWGDGKVSWMAAGDLEPFWKRSDYWTLSFNGEGPG